MDEFRNGSATIRYRTVGDGPALLALAPGGLRASRAETWQHAPWDPLEVFADRYRVVGMDQRNTGTSFAPISSSDGWSSYTGDQIALMDHLGIDTFAVVGMCIGGAFIARLLAEHPDRIAAAVALQPIGLDGNRDAFRQIFDDWRSDIAHEHPEADDAAWDGCWDHLFGGDHRLFSVPDEAPASFSTPILVCQGDDEYHPTSASRHLADTAPRAELVEHWKDGAARDDALDAVAAFLATHAR